MRPGNNEFRYPEFVLRVNGKQLAGIDNQLVELSLTDFFNNIGALSGGIYEDTKLVREQRNILEILSTVELSGSNEVGLCRKIEKDYNDRFGDGSICFKTVGIDFSFPHILIGAEAKIDSPLLTYNNVSKVIEYLEEKRLDSILLFSLMSEEHYCISGEVGHRKWSVIDPADVFQELRDTYCHKCVFSGCKFNTGTDSSYDGCAVFRSLEVISTSDRMESYFDSRKKYFTELTVSGFTKSTRMTKLKNGFGAIGVLLGRKDSNG